MKLNYILRLIAFTSISVLLANCTKDKVTVVIPPNCPDTVSFNAEILPLIQNNCSGCHSSGNGAGYTLTNYTNISSSADAILGSMHGTGYQLMPQGGPALPDSLIQKVACWIYQGKKNN